MTLRDHYVEKAARHSAFLINPDSWALTYINIGRARGIQEAFDGDASGVVTINGVNNFTQSKPPDWRWVISLSIQDVFVHHVIAFPTGWRIVQ